MRVIEKAREREREKEREREIEGERDPGIISNRSKYIHPATTPTILQAGGNSEALTN